MLVEVLLREHSHELLPYCLNRIKRILNYSLPYELLELLPLIVEGVVELQNPGVVVVIVALRRVHIGQPRNSLPHTLAGFQLSLNQIIALSAVLRMVAGCAVQVMLDRSRELAHSFHNCKRRWNLLLFCCDWHNVNGP